MRMPEPEQGIIARRAEIARALRAIVPGEGVIDDTDELRAYESDGLTAYRQVPMIAVLPGTTEQVSRVLAYCHEQGVKVVPRGAGTSLSGGALPLADGVLLAMTKFNRILEVDYRQPLRRGPARGHQPGHHRCGGPMPASTTRPIPPARSPAPSAATWPRTPAGCTA